jgi:hypothetical protein
MEGLHDDAINLSVMVMRVVALAPPNGATIESLGHRPWPMVRAGDALSFFDETTGRIVDAATVTAVLSIEGEGHRQHLVLDPLPAELAVGTMAIDETAANRGSVIRGCTIRRSCRLRCPLLVEDSVIQTYMAVWNEPLEAPVPHDVVFRRNRFEERAERFVDWGGQGHPRTSLSVSTWSRSAPAEPVRSARRILFEDNIFESCLRLERCADVVVAGCELRSVGQPGRLILRDAGPVYLSGLSLDGRALADPGAAVEVQGQAAPGDLRADPAAATALQERVLATLAAEWQRHGLSADGQWPER